MKTNQRVLQMVTMVALFIAIVFISVGFALMSTTLTITGTTKVVPATWDVHFVTGTLQFSNNSTAASADSNHTPTLTTSSFSGYQIVLTKPGDKGTYTFDVTNAGSLNAKVSSADFDEANVIATSGTQADQTIALENVTYTVVWDDTGAAIATNDTLAAGATRTIRVEAEYDPDADELPAGEVVLAGRDLTIEFVQAN